MKKFNIGFGSVLFIILMGYNFAFAMTSPHPVLLFDQGMQKLANYKGSEKILEDAKNKFLYAIDKYPKSPLGYLGMSRAYIIDSYLYGDHYDMQRIKTYALPFALKSLELGSSLREAHDNFAFIEKIFSMHAEYQKTAKSYLASFPDNPETYFTIANFVRDQGKISAAIDYYKYALDLSPKPVLKFKILQRLGYMHLALNNNPQKAIEYYKQALEIYSSHPIVLQYIGIAYMRLERYVEAIKYLERAYEQSPITDIQHNLFWARGMQAQKMGRTEQAIKYFEKCLEFGSDDTGQIKLKLGNLYYRKKNYQFAYEIFEQVINQQPHDAIAYFYAGKAADSLGQKSLAEDYFKKYLEIRSDGKKAAWIKEHISNSIDE